MHLGFSTMNTHMKPQPAELASILEDRGYESLWYGEHSQIPTSRHSPHPREETLPEPYKNMMDPYISLTAAAAASTTRTGATAAAALHGPAQGSESPHAPASVRLLRRDCRAHN